MRTGAQGPLLARLPGVGASDHDTSPEHSLAALGWENGRMDQNRAWFLQANPKHYDIDAALGTLDRIWWRVPQHTTDINISDAVVLWRSGKDAGIVGVGRVVAEPQLRPIDPAERPYLRAEDDTNDATRALIRLQRTPFVAKEQVQAIVELRQHQIVRAPMGTVFPISDEEWTGLKPFLSVPPDVVEAPGSALPPAFAWRQRSKGVLPMPGGYGGYLKSLAKVCTVVAEERPTPVELAVRLETVLEVSATGARLRESFLRKVGIISVQGGVCQLGIWTEKWLASGDERMIAALLHARCQFIGELLDAAREPRTNDELLAIANERYGMGWDTQTQIANRRGWLQSAKMLADTGDGRVQTIASGRLLLTELTLYDPTVGPLAIAPADTPPVEAAIELLPPPASTIVDRIVDSIKDSATDSLHPYRFEHAVRDAFAFLGFQADWLGGSGKTDVLVDAMLGRADSYRLIVDCKTSGSGSVSDQQVDWVTLTEHKSKYDAQHVVLVGPKPSGTRLFERAEQYKVTVISADQIAGLCCQHAKAPLGLDDYQSLFAHGGSLDTQAVDERAEDVKRLVVLAAAVCATIRARSAVFGRLSARDLFLILASEPVAEGTTEGELQTVLDTLASPLLGVLQGSKNDGYRVTTSANVAKLRIDVVAQQLSAAVSNGEENVR
jgi:hypothetical protein